MQIWILLAFITVLALPQAMEQARAGEPADISPWLPAALLMYLLGAILLGWVGRAVTAKAIRGRREFNVRFIRRHQSLMVGLKLWLLAGLGGLILLGLHAWVDRTPLRYLPLLPRLVVLGPFATGLIIAWTFNYLYYLVLRRQMATAQGFGAPSVARPWTLGEYLVFNIRHDLLYVLVPLSLIIVVTDSLWLYLWPAEVLSPSARLSVITAGSLVWAAAVFLLAPAVVMRVWKTAPLPQGPYRQGLERISTRLKLRYRAIRVWLSGGMIVNAGVLGAWGRFRYVLLSDALLEQMTPPQIESVFAHEAGHIVSHHISYSILFAFAAAGLAGAAGTGVSALLGGGQALADALMLVFMLAAWTGGFGWLSRRFERQSDVIAAWAMSHDGSSDAITSEGAELFAEALDRVGRLNGMRPWQFNWRHGSIHWRINYILRLAHTAGSRRPVDREMRRVKIAIWSAAGVAAALVAVQAAAS